MTRSAQLKPSGPEVADVIRKWQAYLEKGRPDKAEKLCRKALKRFPEDVALLLTAAPVIADEDEKKRLVRRAVALAPDNADALTMAATTMFHSQELDEAAEYLSRAAALDPEGSQLGGDRLYIAGRIAAVREQNEPAEEMLRAAYETQPELPHRGAAYAEILAIRGRYDEALKVVNASVRRFPGDEWLLRLRRDLLKATSRI